MCVRGCPLFQDGARIPPTAISFGRLGRLRMPESHGSLGVAPPSPPKQLGRFEVGAKIGGGGMASVYLGRAEREDGTEQVVALKVIRDELAQDEQFTQMFIDEAKILA